MTAAKISDMGLAAAAVNAAYSVLDDVDWTGLLNKAHEAMAYLATEAELPPGVDRREAQAIVVGNLAIVNAARTFLMMTAQANAERNRARAAADVDD